MIIIKEKKLYFIFLIFVVLFISGCKDITDSYKAGSFGKTAEEDAMLNAITSKYGDMTKDGNPRFLEATMTSEVYNFIPVDKVSAYSNESEKLIVWFVYDNFKNDVLNIKWIYLDDDYSIHTFTSKTGDDFGRGSFILEMPEDGWPIGSYRVTISGAGVSESINFKIIDGPTVSSPLDLLIAEETPETKDTIDSASEDSKPGWYLVDVIDKGDKYDSTHPYYSYDVDYKRGDVTTSVIGDEGETLIVRTIYNAPPEYIPAEGEIAIPVSKEGVMVHTGGLTMNDKSNIVLDAADIDFGAGTGSHYRLKDETYGEFFTLGSADSTGTFKEGIFKGKAPAANMYHGKMSIKYEVFSMAMYGTKYIYEWRD
ncbi:MAG TPA: hypothetical protein PLX15_02125 [Candidatus Woesearchaeota archaeon]|nr:hypothetical protein [Candidatus Woesearchaeota archaeon]